MPDFEKMTTEELKEAARKYYLEKEDYKLKYELEHGRLMKMKQDKFGSTSEKSIALNQLTLFDEVDELAVIEEDEIIKEEKQALKGKKRKTKRYAMDDLPDNIPTETVLHDLNHEEKEKYGNKIKQIGVDIHKELVYVPGYYKVIVHEYPKYAIKDENGYETVVYADHSGFLFPKSPVSSSLVSHLMTEKYLLGVPMNRQIQVMEKQGIGFKPQTVAKWMIDTAEQYLVRVYDKLHEILLMEEIMNADETHHDIFTGKKNEPEYKKKKKRTYIWMFRTGITATRPIVMYVYSDAGRKAEVATKFLDGYVGYLLTDNYDGYNGVEGAIRCLCNIHARRYMVDLYKQGKKNNPIVLNTIEIYQEIFHRDGQIREKYGNDYEKIRIAREKELSDLFIILFAYLENSKEMVMPNSDLMKAINYILNGQVGFTNFMLDGRLELSNNLSERTMKPVITNRKNSLFFGSEKGATGSCIISTIVQTAKENGINVEAYLNYLLQELSKENAPSDEDLNEMMPWCNKIQNQFGTQKK